MRYGLALPNGGPDLGALADLAAVAESSGWDGVFIEDYVVYHGQWHVPTYDPGVLLAAMSSRTKRVRLGTMVTSLTRRRPWRVAQEAATIDQLSAGRLILGVGAGDPADPTYERLGEETDPRRRAHMFDEAVEIIAAAWNGQPFSYSGRFFQIRDVAMSLRPVQRPRVPIWIAGRWPGRGPARRMLRWDGCCPHKGDPGEPWQDLTPDDISAIRAAADARPAGGSLEIVIGARRRRPDWDAERAHIASIARVGAAWWIEWVPVDDIAKMRAAVEAGPLRVA